MWKSAKLGDQADGSTANVNKYRQYVFPIEFDLSREQWTDPTETLKIYSIHDNEKLQLAVNE